MTPSPPESLAVLLQAALEAWRVAGEVRRDGHSLLVVSLAPDCKAVGGESTRSIRITRAPAGLPFRFAVTIGERERMATGVAGVLRLVRGAVDADYEGVRLRVGRLPPVAT